MAAITKIIPKNCFDDNPSRRKKLDAATDTNTRPAYKIAKADASIRLSALKINMLPNPYRKAKRIKLGKTLLKF